MSYTYNTTYENSIERAVYRLKEPIKCQHGTFNKGTVVELEKGVKNSFSDFVCDIVGFSDSSMLYYIVRSFDNGKIIVDELFYHINSQEQYETAWSNTFEEVDGSKEYYDSIKKLKAAYDTQEITSIFSILIGIIALIFFLVNFMFQYSHFNDKSYITECIISGAIAFSSLLIMLISSIKGNKIEKTINQQRQSFLTKSDFYSQ